MITIIARRQALFGTPGGDQSEQGQDTTLAVIIGAHDQDSIFDRDDHDQRPKDQGDDAEDRLRGDSSRDTCRFCCDLQRVEGTLPIAEDNAHTGKRRRAEIAVRKMARISLFSGGHRHCPSVPQLS